MKAHRHRSGDEARHYGTICTRASSLVRVSLAADTCLMLRCLQLTDAGLEVLAAHPPKQLRHVTVAGCEFVTRQVRAPKRHDPCVTGNQVPPPVDLRHLLKCSVPDN